MKLRMPKTLIATESEYRANHAGLNTFFGAVLGFVLAGTEQLDPAEFAFMLFAVSGIVISILYVSASAHKLTYSALTLAMVFALPTIVDPLFDKGEQLPANLQPALPVWTLLSIAVEYLPRRPDDGPVPAD